MLSNKLSTFLGITTFGESHGTAIGVVIDGVIPNITFPRAQILSALEKRRPHGAHSTSRVEPDQLEILSGVYEGKTTGMPICILIRNSEFNSDDYKALQDIFRPGHADFSWFAKYKIYDFRGGGRASGRETVARVLAAELYRPYLNEVSFSYNTVQIGILKSDSSDYKPFHSGNPFSWHDSNGTAILYNYLDEVKAHKDSVGGIVKIQIEGLPSGLGDPLYEKLDANISKALMSIGSVKGILFGDGLELATHTGSNVNDQIAPTGFTSNHLGGINGGVTNGMPLVISVVIRPIPSIGITQQTINTHSESQTITINGRHDVCHISRIIPVLEAMLVITLAEAMISQNLILGHTPRLHDYRETLDKIDEDIILALYRRKQIVNQVKQLKTDQNLPAIDLKRESEIFAKTAEFADSLGLDAERAIEIIRQAIDICRS